MTRLDKGFEPVEDLYETLGAPSDSTPDEIKAAFNRRASETNPERNKSPVAYEQFRRVCKAYWTLSDPDQRQAYDSQLLAIRANPTSWWGQGRLEIAVDMWVRETLPEGILKVIADQVLVNGLRTTMSDYASAMGLEPDQKFTWPGQRDEAVKLALGVIDAHKKTLIGIVNSYPTAKEQPALNSSRRSTLLKGYSYGHAAHL